MKTTTLPLVAAESLSDCGVDDDGESEAGQDPEDDVLPQPAATAATKIGFVRIRQHHMICGMVFWERTAHMARAVAQY